MKHGDESHIIESIKKTPTKQIQVNRKHIVERFRGFHVELWKRSPLWVIFCYGSKSFVHAAPLNGWCSFLCSFQAPGKRWWESYSFLLGRPVFRGYVSFGEGISNIVLCLKITKKLPPMINRRKLNPTELSEPSDTLTLLSSVSQKSLRTYLLSKKKLPAISEKKR